MIYPSPIDLKKKCNMCKLYLLDQLDQLDQLDRRPMATDASPNRKPVQG